jgi:hypothetical protein
MTVAHSALTPASGIHVAHAVVYADATARNAASPATGTLAYQTDTAQFWIRNASAWLLTGLGVNDAALGNKSATGVKAVIYTSEIDDGNSSTADTIDWSAGSAHKSTLTGNCTYTFTAPAGVTALSLKIVQDGTGGRTITWPAAVKNATALNAALTTTLNTTSIVSLYYDGTSYWGGVLCTGVA